MFEALLWSAFVIVLIGVAAALDGSRDVFHPLVFVGPMFAFLYGWMPLRLLSEDGLSRYFDGDQLLFVQALNLAGIIAFFCACLAAGSRLKRQEVVPQLSMQACWRLKLGGASVGGVGLLCWLISIINVGGFVNAFDRSYSGGWDDSGYIRDGSLLLLVGVLLLIAVIAREGPRVTNVALAALFGLPWLTQALLTARRGPTFAFAVVVLMGWYLNRNRRPPAVAVAVSGFLLGWLVLFLVTNRGNIYLGSHLDSVDTDVTTIVDKPDTGNEYIYGTGAVLASRRRDQYFWMRRYLAQVLVRPIPSSVWPTKYEDVGLPEIARNAGTGEGFGDALGWVGAVGSAPGIVADLWVEVSWFAVGLMAVLGWCYGSVWRKAVTGGPAWSSQYVILAALSLYMVMQTMEAVIFRTLLLSIPSWIVWKWALRAASSPAAVSVEVLPPGDWPASEDLHHA